MKKLFTLVALVAAIFSYNGVFAQCTLNLNNSTFGFTPTSSSVAQGASETQKIEVFIPGTISTYTIDSVVVTGITGLPAGITYTLNPANGHIVTTSAGGNGEGSICLSGSTTAAAGTYPLTFVGTITLSGLGTQSLALVNTVDPTFGDSVIVTAAAATATCDTFADINFATDTPNYFGWEAPSEGFASGNGSLSQGGTFYPELATAEEFTSGIGDSVTIAAAFFGYATVNAGDSANLVKAYIYDNTGAGGTPGNAIDSATTTLKDIAIEVTETNTLEQLVPILFNFTHNVALTTSDFFVAIKYPQTTGDTIVLFTNNGGSPYGRGYLDVAGQWLRYTQILGSNVDSLGDFILVGVCGSAFPPVASFTQSATTGCAPLTVTFTDASTGGTSYSWNFGDGSAVSTLQSPPHTYTAAGTYTVTETVTNTSGSATFSSGVTVNASPSTTVYVTNATTSSSTDGAAGVVATGGSGSFAFAWSGSSDITDSLSGVAAGTYYVTVTSGGCSTTDTVVISFGSGINTLSSNAHIKIYPNPANDQLNFEWNLNDEATITIYDVTGQAIRSYMVNSSVSKLDIHEFAAGLYVLRVVDNTNNEQQSLTFTKF